MSELRKVAHRGYRFRNVIKFGFMLAFLVMMCLSKALVSNKIGIAATAIAGTDFQVQNRVLPFPAHSCVLAGTATIAAK